MVSKMKDVLIQTIALSLKDGGWKSCDRDEIKTYYDLTEEETESIVEMLAYYEDMDKLELEE